MCVPSTLVSDRLYPYSSRYLPYRIRSRHSTRRLLCFSSHACARAAHSTGLMRAMVVASVAVREYMPANNAVTNTARVKGSKNQDGDSFKGGSKNAWATCLRGIMDAQQRLLDRHMIAPTYGQVFLFNPAFHWNLGDSFIVLGELLFIAKMQRNVVLCRGPESHGLGEYCNPYQQKSRLAVFTAGGNWGDLWPDVHEWRIEQISKMLSSGAHIFQMPQSLHYDSQSKSFEDARILKIMASGAPGSVVLSWRQFDSYRTALRLYPTITNLLIPDIAFAIGPLDVATHTCPTTSKVDFLFLLREDKESVLGGDRAVVRAMLPAIFASRGAVNRTFAVVDWWDSTDCINGYTNSAAERLSALTRTNVSITKEFAARLTSGSSLLARGRVVVTDRLHASILSLLLHLPHVNLDQSYGKIRRTRDVAFAASNSDCINKLALRYQDVEWPHNASRMDILHAAVSAGLELLNKRHTAKKATKVEK